MKPIYLDHSATTPVREEVVRAMLPYFSIRYGNASSLHAFGQEARRAIQAARKSVARSIDVDPAEIVFTSGGTESDNLAIQGVARAKGVSGGRIITSSVEHPAVMNCCKHLEREGFKITFLPVDGNGVVDPQMVENAIRPDTALVSVMLANNETGAIQPIKMIGGITRSRGVPFHTDAVQAAGKIAVRPDDLHADLVSLSGHKIGGPKGVGVLYIREGVPFVPLMHGGSHEMGFRPGTENVAAIVGMAKAVEMAEEERNRFSQSTRALRSDLEEGIRGKIEDVRINGHSDDRLSNILNVSFRHVDGESLQLVLNSKGFAVSTGSACSSGSSGPSHVLRAMGVPAEFAGGTVRFSFGKSNGEEDVRRILSDLPDIIAQLRG